MHIVGQIVDKNLHRRGSCSSALWINPDKYDNWQAASEQCANLRLFSQDRACFNHLCAAGARVEFAATPELSNEKYHWLILKLPRQKALLDMLLDCAANLLADDGVLWLAGENKAGIKSASKWLQKHFANVTKLDSARHCTLFEAATPILSSSFDIDAYQQVWTLPCRNRTLNISSYPGVFAHGRLDSGTALLLDALEDVQIGGDVLDFAAGAGVLGAFIAAKHPHANVTLLDSNALALKASAQTLALNDLKGRVLASDGLTEVDCRYDYIISNPPIHSGLKTENLLSQRLLVDVDKYLNEAGTLIIVANRHLPYEGWLSKNFNSFKQLTENAEFKVIAAIK